MFPINWTDEANLLVFDENPEHILVATVCSLEKKERRKKFRPGVAGSNPAGGWISFCFLTSLSSLSELHFISSVSIIRSLWEVRLGKGSSAALCEKADDRGRRGLKEIHEQDPILPKIYARSIFGLPKI